MGSKSKLKKTKTIKNNVKIGALICAGVAAVISAITILAINGQNNKEIEEQTAIYDGYVEVAGKINSKIDEAVKTADEAGAKDVGEDRSKVDEINQKKEELLEYRITVNEEKPAEIGALKEENARLKEVLGRVDEKLNDLSREEMSEYTLGEDSAVVTIANQISALAGEIDVLANQQAERKAAEEREQKILSGDISVFAGNYKEVYYGSGGSSSIAGDGTITIDGRVRGKPQQVQKNADGSYTCVMGTLETVTGFKIKSTVGIYPAGVASEDRSGDINKVRIVDTTSGMSMDGVYEKLD